MSGIHRTQLPPDPYRPRTPEEMHQTIRRARAEQTETIRLVARLAARKLRRSAAWGAIDRTVRVIAAACRRLLQFFAERWRHRQAMAALGGLTESALKDIGVTRSEIPWIARHGRRPPPKGAVDRTSLQLVLVPAAPAMQSQPPTLPPANKHAA